VLDLTAATAWYIEKLGLQNIPVEIYASNVKKAREVLGSRGVNVGDIQEDRQGTHYFQMRDLEGNLIEVSEEP